MRPNVEKVGIEPTATTLARRVRYLSCRPQAPLSGPRQWPPRVSTCPTSTLPFLHFRVTAAGSANQIPLAYVEGDHPSRCGTLST